jgi:hypothetical protein
MVVDKLSDRQLATSHGPILGHIVRLTPEGVAVVDYPGNSAGPREAAIAVQPPPRRGGEWPPVLLAFLNGDASTPVIIGFVRRNFNIPKVAQKRKKLALEAEEEIALNCGKSSILLRRDGKIVIKGREIASRASGTNKVQGGSVRLN